MLAKVADGTIDAVVGFGDMDGPTNTRPQKPHDYVPGAWIACQAGATAIDIDTGRPLEFGYSLLHPDRPGKRYIVARSAALAARCLSAVQGAGLTGHA
jgi:3'-phosphoadenosine 5'-phosphosulfate (PAPS) 3'-phosphatase